MIGWLASLGGVFTNELFPFLKSSWPVTKDFFNSVFFTAIAGSLAGAFAGAMAAQRIAEKTRNKDELLREIRNTNASTMVAFGICNTLLSAKKQHIKSLKEQFDREKVLAQEAVVEQQKGQHKAINFHADFRTFPALTLPLSILQGQIFEKLSIGGRPIALMTTLIQIIDGLNGAIARRNHLVEYYKTSSLPANQMLALYFGFALNGQTNQEYPDSVEAIYRQAGDGIFYSSQLCNELSQHGERLSSTFKKHFGDSSLRITKPDFSKAIEAGLMPSNDDYADWFNMFIDRKD